MVFQELYRRFERYRTLQTDKIHALPILILMPHSACNCRCVMCDIWKDNQNLRQLSENDIKGLLGSLKKYGTQLVVMSGGEALLNRNFFSLCSILRKAGVRICLLSTGLTIKQHAPNLSEWVDQIIVSLDGDEKTHDAIRNIPGAFHKLKEGIRELRSINPSYPITGRSVIHQLNFRTWPSIIDSAREIGLDQISFLPADVSSHAFNREQAWGLDRQQDILIPSSDLPELQEIINLLISQYRDSFESRFIAETPGKIQKIYTYYAAQHGLNPFPYKKCNAPWVSAVIEADGTVRPCFFHGALGNIHAQSLDEILNSEQATQFRKGLDIDTNSTCVKCVCYLNLPPGMNPSGS